MQKENEPEVELEQPDIIVEERKQSLEHDVLSRDTVRLKNICGLMIIATMCIVTLILSVAVYETIAQGKPWPSNITMLIIVSPLGIMGWAYINVNGTIRMLAGLPGAIADMRSKVAEVVKPK